MENTGDASVYNIVLHESITDDQGNVLVTYEWDVGDLLVGEIAIIDYSVIINGVAPNAYSFVASAYGRDSAGDKVRSNEGTVRVAVLGGASRYVASTKKENSSSFVPEAFASDGVIRAGDGVPNDDNALQIWLLSLLLYALVMKRSQIVKKKKEI